jgi:DNA processing protein
MARVRPAIPADAASAERIAASDAWIALAHATEPGEEAVGALAVHRGPAAVLESIRSGSSGLRHEEGMRARLEGVSAADARGHAAALGARILTPEDHEWPRVLDALGARRPLALWVLGAADLRLLALRAVAVVGARSCSPYGEEVARSWAGSLAASGWTVVSGAAFGIDAAAHRGALRSGGMTIAVMAGGVDVPYPRAHAALLAAIADQGLVVSEVPLGQQVRRQRFLSRNRLIAALGRTTVVVEAAERSGTTATARAAAQMGRPVIAVPGPVTSPVSAGCHRMVQDGLAVLAAEWTDVLAAADLDAWGRAQSDETGVAESDRQPEDPRDRWSEREARLMDALPTRGWMDLASVMRSSGLPARDVLAGTALLVSAGWMEQGASGWRRVRVPTRDAPR